MTWGVRGVSVRHGDRSALEDVTLELTPGRISVVLGGDGSGKTTLCRTVVGLEEISTGEVMRPPRTGFQPETSGVWSDLTTLENLEFVARGYGLDPSHARTRIEDLLTAADLASARDRLGRELSGGMRQKLGVAMAVLSEPELLVLDEPTTGLDPVSRLELWSFINVSAREGRAVMVSTTYLDEAARGGTLLALEQGRVLAAGQVGDIVASMPGRLFEADRKMGDRSWRRGSTWRIWSDSGGPHPGAREIEPDLSDVITVAALGGEPG